MRASLGNVEYSMHASSGFFALYHNFFIFVKFFVNLCKIKSESHRFFIFLPPYLDSRGKNRYNRIIFRATDITKGMI